MDTWVKEEKGKPLMRIKILHEFLFIRENKFFGPLKFKIDLKLLFSFVQDYCRLVAILLFFLLIF